MKFIIPWHIVSGYAGNVTRNSAIFLETSHGIKEQWQRAVKKCIGDFC